MGLERGADGLRRLASALRSDTAYKIEGLYSDAGCRPYVASGDVSPSCGRSHEQVSLFEWPFSAHRERIAGYAADGYRGCIGRTLDRISIFPDGRAYVCSSGRWCSTAATNEFDLFTRVLTASSCGGGCKESLACAGGCPAEELVQGSASCDAYPDVVPVCRLWKADVPNGTPY